MPPYANGQATAHSYLNRNKHAVALDLKDPANIELIKSKISDYDIVIEQFRPGVMQRLGLDYQTLSEINPRLIYCSITGYGQTGGIKIKQDTISTMWLCQGSRDIVADSTVDHHQWGFKLRILQGGSLHSVIGILAAVIERQRSGLGQYIDISMTDCVVGLSSMAAAASLAGQEETRA